MAKRSRVQQGLLQFPLEWGERREGAGRKPASGKRRVAHRKKAELKKDCPLHITIRLRSGLPSMRRKAAYCVLRAAFAAGKERFGFRLVHYSVMGTHAHLIVEADDCRALRRGMSGLMVRMARGLNRLWGRRAASSAITSTSSSSSRRVRCAIRLHTCCTTRGDIASCSRIPSTTTRLVPGLPVGPLSWKSSATNRGRSPSPPRAPGSSARDGAVTAASLSTKPPRGPHKVTLSIR